MSLHRNLCLMLNILVLALLGLKAQAQTIFYNEVQAIDTEPKRLFLSLDQIFEKIRDYTPESARIRFDLEMNQGSLRDMEYRYDPYFQGNLNYRESTWYNNAFDPTANNPYGYNEDYVRGYGSSIGIAKPIETGGRLELNFLHSNDENKWAYQKDANGKYVRPLQEQATAMWQFRFVQPLLKNSGFHINEVPKTIHEHYVEMSRLRSIASLKRRYMDFLRLYCEYCFYTKKVDALNWVIRGCELALKTNIQKQNEETLRQRLGEFVDDLTYTKLRMAEYYFRIERYVYPGIALQTHLIEPDYSALNKFFNKELSLVEGRQKIVKHFKDRPEYLEAKLSSKVSSLQLEQAKNDAKPSLDFYSSYGFRGLASDIDSAATAAADYESSTREWNAGITFSVPLFERQAVNREERAQKNVYSTEQYVKQVEEQILSDCNITLYRMAGNYHSWRKAADALNNVEAGVTYDTLLAREVTAENVNQIRSVLDALHRESWHRWDYLKTSIEFDYYTSKLLSDRQELFDLATVQAQTSLE